MCPGYGVRIEIEIWQVVTDAVHAKGSFIVLQLWALGRATSLEGLHAEDSLPYDFASDISESLLVLYSATSYDIWNRRIYRAVRHCCQEFYQSAIQRSRNSRCKWIFFVDQLMQDLSNKRTVVEDPSRTDVSFFSKSSIKPSKPSEQRGLGFDFPRVSHGNGRPQTHVLTSFKRSNIFIHLLHTYTLSNLVIKATSTLTKPILKPRMTFCLKFDIQRYYC